MKSLASETNRNKLTGSVELQHVFHHDSMDGKSVRVWIVCVATFPGDNVDQEIKLATNRHVSQGEMLTCCQQQNACGERIGIHLVPHIFLRVILVAEK